LSDLVAWARHPGVLRDKCVTEIAGRFRILLAVLSANGLPVTEAASLIEDSLKELDDADLFSVRLWQRLLACDGQRAHRAFGRKFFLVQFVCETPEPYRERLEVELFSLNEQTYARWLTERKLSEKEADELLSRAFCELWRIIHELGDSEVRRRTRHETTEYWSHDVARRVGIYCKDQHE
jgi:hypothetical protein